ncbi:MAG TPA: FAD-binding oxidoreductase [Gaiellaceae bacterium]|nr:FAD-binding oxidoreductase [Gaiellaceae bacterium]
MPRPAVAIVGAGVTGLSIAFHLAERGVGPVRVYERSGIGAGASGVQPGGVRLQWGTEINCRMALESMEFWRNAQVDFGFRACGYLWLAHSDAVLDNLRTNVGLQNSLGIPSRIVSPAEAAELVPGLQPDGLAGGAWCDEDGYFDRPQAVVEALAARADIEIANIRSLDELDAETVVVAAGVDTPQLVEVPIVAEERYLFFSEPIRERLLEPLVIAPERRFAAKQLGDGRVLASDLGGYDRTHVRDVMGELLPQLEFARLDTLVPGTYDVTPDHQAILGQVEERIWVAAGFSGHGFMMAPAVGRSIAGAIAGDTPDEYLRALSPDRFARGAQLPEPSVV